MAFSISPYVLVNELDLTGTIQAASTSNGALILRNTYKGQEFEYTEVSNENEIVVRFGIPTDSSYVDMLTGAAFLAKSDSLKCVRAMPASAKYAGLKIRKGYVQTSTSTAAISASERSLINLDSSTFDNYNFPDQMASQSSYGVNDAAWMISSSRGTWGNNVRVLMVDKYFYDCIKYFNTTTKITELPPSYVITSDTQAASAAAVTAYNNYVSYSLGNGITEDVGSVYSIIKNTSVNLKDATEFLVIVQVIPQSDTVWQTQEAWQVSIDETATDSSGSSKFAESVINAKSDYIRISINPDIKITSELEASQIASRKMIIGMQKWASLVDGSNGVWGVNEESAVCMQALELFANPEETDIQIILDGAKATDVKNAMIALAEKRRDCMVILDVPADTVLNVSDPATEIVKWRLGYTTATAFNPSSSYAVIYANWLEVYDKWNKKYRWVPASGFAGAVWAHTDTIAAPWFAPSGYNRAVITGPRKIAWNPDFTKRNIIMEEGINPIIKVSGTGTLILGQKTTLSESSAFQDINVRRLFITLEKTIATRAKYYLEEPNDDTTRLRFVNEIVPYIKGIKSSRGIYAYSVICDSTNNSPTLIDQDILRCDIFIQPARTASRIVLNFVGTKTGANFDEISIDNYTVSGVVM